VRKNRGKEGKEERSQVVTMARKERGWYGELGQEGR